MTSKNGDFLDKEEMARMYPDNGDPACPDCGGNLFKGPEAGLSINVKCENCEAEFNVLQGLGKVERISDRRAKLMNAGVLRGQN